MSNTMPRFLASLILIICIFLLLLCNPLAHSNKAEANLKNISNDSALDLKITSRDPINHSFQLHNIAPGDNGQGIIRMINSSKVAGGLSISYSEVRNVIATTDEYRDMNEYLSASIVIALYIDVDTNDNWNNGDIGLKADGTTYDFTTNLVYDSLDNYSGVSWKQVETMNALATDNFVIIWHLPITVGNEIQGSSLDFDITFVLEQMS